MKKSFIILFLAFILLFGCTTKLSQAVDQSGLPIPVQAETNQTTTVVPDSDLPPMPPDDSGNTVTGSTTTTGSNIDMPPPPPSE